VTTWKYNSVVVANLSLQIKWVGHITRFGDLINFYKILVGKHEMNKPLEGYEMLRKAVLSWILQKYLISIEDKRIYVFGVISSAGFL
jgi:hypothetical protein